MAGVERAPGVQVSSLRPRRRMASGCWKRSRGARPNHPCPAAGATSRGGRHQPRGDAAGRCGGGRGQHHDDGLGMPQPQTKQQSTAIPGMLMPYFTSTKAWQQPRLGVRQHARRCPTAAGEDGDTATQPPTNIGLQTPPWTITTTNRPRTTPAVAAITTSGSVLLQGASSRAATTWGCHQDGQLILAAQKQQQVNRDSQTHGDNSPTSRPQSQASPWPLRDAHRNGWSTQQAVGPHAWAWSALQRRTEPQQDGQG